MRLADFPLSDPVSLRRVEEAALNSWPAPRQVLLGGWVLRFGGGYTRRANSVTALDGGEEGSAEVGARLVQCEALYAAQGLAALVRVRSFGDVGLAGVLRGRGYVAEGLSSVLWMGFDGGAGAAVDGGIEGVEVEEGRAGADWLEGQRRMSGCDVEARGRILDAVAVPCAFAGVRAAGAGSPVVAVAFGAIHGGVLCLHCVTTDVGFRRRGLSGRVVSALLGWARGVGACGGGACGASLQVAAENVGALALYGGLGFGTELFRYEYWRQP